MSISLKKHMNAEVTCLDFTIKYFSFKERKHTYISVLYLSTKVDLSWSTKLWEIPTFICN